MGYETLSSMISVTNPSDSHILKIYVLTESAQLSIDIANTLLKYGIDHIYRIVGNDEPTIIDAAVDKTTKLIKRSTAKTSLIGAMLGGVLVCGIFILRFLLDMTFKTEDDIENYMKLPVIAVVPMYTDEENDEKNSFKKRRRKKKNG